MEDEDKITRYKNNVDTYNLLDTDGATESHERSIIGELIFRDMIKKLENDRDRFIAACLADGFSKADIAYMLSIDPAMITRASKRIRICLVEYYKAGGIKKDTPKI